MAKGISINGITYEFGNKPVKLWENPSPSASFAAQTITLSDDVENYDFIGIICAQGNGSTGRTRLLPMIFWPVGSTKSAYMTISTYRNYVRAFTPSKDTITVNGCSYYGTYGSSDASADNTAIIPRYIYGFKY